MPKDGSACPLILDRFRDLPFIDITLYDPPQPSAFVTPPFIVSDNWETSQELILVFLDSPKRTQNRFPARSPSISEPSSSEARTNEAMDDVYKAAVSYSTGGGGGVTSVTPFAFPLCEL